MCVIYHNSKCSKSRLTKQLLEENNIDFKVINYLDNPPNKQELTTILQNLKIKAKDFIRSGESIFSELNLQNATENELILAMVENPILIERPIVKTNKGVCIGRPPENILKIL